MELDTPNVDVDVDARVESYFNRLFLLLVGIVADVFILFLHHYHGELYGLNCCSSYVLIYAAVKCVVFIVFCCDD